MRSILLLGVFVLSASIIPQHANSQEDNSRLLNEVSQEFASCWGYYSLVAMCLDPNRDADVITAYRAAMKQLSQGSYIAGKAAGLSLAALVARMDLSLSKMQDDTDKDCRNISVILQKYAKKCKGIVENPEAAINEIKQRIQ